jgi:phosphoribosylamine---glycine ligase
MVARRAPSFKTLKGFSAGIVMTTPPFPYARPNVQEPLGLPVLFDERLTEEDRATSIMGK